MRVPSCMVGTAHERQSFALKAVPSAFCPPYKREPQCCDSQRRKRHQYCRAAAAMSSAPTASTNTGIQISTAPSTTSKIPPTTTVTSAKARKIVNGPGNVTLACRMPSRSATHTQTWGLEPSRRLSRPGGMISGSDRGRSGGPWSELVMPEHVGQGWGNAMAPAAAPSHLTCAALLPPRGVNPADQILDDRTLRKRNKANGRAEADLAPEIARLAQH